jgi:hypothetical protein
MDTNVCKRRSIPIYEGQIRNLNYRMWREDVWVIVGLTSNGRLCIIKRMFDYGICQHRSADR